MYFDCGIVAGVFSAATVANDDDDDDGGAGNEWHITCTY